MELLDETWRQLGHYINAMYLFTFMLIAYCLKSNLEMWIAKVTKKKWKSVYTVLIVATIVAIPFLVSGAPFTEVLFTYTLGTSLHELVFQWIEKKFKVKKKIEDHENSD